MSDDQKCNKQQKPQAPTQQKPLPQTPQIRQKQSDGNSIRNYNDGRWTVNKSEKDAGGHKPKD